VSMEPYPTPNLIKQNLMEILREISFVDKIIFGKLNYNVKSSQFNENRDFYRDCAETVMKFCKNEGIEYHIKYGTLEKGNQKTDTIFIEEDSTSTDRLRQPSLSI